MTMITMVIATTMTETVMTETGITESGITGAVSYTHLRAHETREDLGLGV